MSNRLPWRIGRSASPAALALTLVVFGCNADRTITGSFPNDYRERHPISLIEGTHEIQLFIGSGRGDLTAEQRAQVTSMALSWNREGTGILHIDVPHGTRNARAAKYAAREVQSLLRASGVPARGMTTRSYRISTVDGLGPIRLAYARIVAQAPACGNWPEDLGAAPRPSLTQLPPSTDNRPYWNLACAMQNNLAAAVANPQDLVQPRVETPPLAARRQQVIEKYRKGENPSGTYETGETAQASDVAP